MGYTTKQRSQEDWIKVTVHVYKEYFLKETDKAMCFKLWGKKFIAFPKSLLKNMTVDDEMYTFTLPKWYIAEHSLKSIVDEQEKHLFPTKKEQAERLQATLDFSTTVSEPRPSGIEVEGKAVEVRIDDDEYAPVEW